MTNILRQLYRGEIYPDNEVIPRDKDYRSTKDEIKKERDYFKEILSEADNIRFNNWEDLRGRFSFMHEYAYFAYGFKLAIRLMLEACGGEKDSEE